MISLINIHTHTPSHKTSACALYNHDYSATDAPHNGLMFSAGLHPWFINDGYDNELLRLSEFIMTHSPVAIGEAGLDKAITLSFAVQEEVFLFQASLAAKRHLPMIIHAVRSYNEIIKCRKMFADAPPWIIHGFLGNAIQAEQLIAHGLYVSFGQHLCEGKGKAAQIIHLIDKEKIFFETDNAAISIEEVYLCASKLTGLSVDEWQKVTANNFKRVFGFEAY